MKIRVLLADDHTLVRSGLRLVLMAEPDMEVVGEAADGVVACELAATLKPDVAVLDVTMPRRSGLEAVPRIREVHPGCRIVILSMHGESAFVREAFKLGVHGYVTKDTELDELPRAIRTVHAGKHYVCPEVAFTVATGFRQTGDDVTPLDGEVQPAMSFRLQSVLRLLAEGKSSKEVAFTLGISSKTVDAHRRAIMERLKAETTADLVRYAIRMGLIPHA
jgi:DNA-binding NarL/FixJ family response regulator